MTELQTPSSDETPSALLKSEAESLLKNILPYVEPLGDYFAVKPESEVQVKTLLRELMYVRFGFGLVSYQTQDKVIHKVIGLNNQPFSFPSPEIASQANIKIVIDSLK